MNKQANFGQYLRKLINKYNLKPTDLALKLNVDDSLVRKWISGSRVPSLKSNYYDVLCRTLNLNHRERLLLKYRQLFALDETTLQIVKNEERYRRLFQKLPVPVLITKPDGRIVAANPASCVFFKMNEQEILESRRNKITDPKDQGLFHALMEQPNTTKASSMVMHIKKNGTKQFTEIPSKLNDGLETYLIICEL